jgi:uncharacterized protein YjbI with pentapeptide repeats
LPTCQYKYESDFPSKIKFECKELSIANSKFCIFHDKDHYAQHQQEVTKRFDEKVLESISQNKPLECIGYYLPEINFAKLKGVSFAQPVYFSGATFSKGASFWDAAFSEGKANFFGATFSEEANFSQATFYEALASFFRAKFLAEANFVDGQFGDKTLFRETLFEQPNKVTFDNNNLSNVSFADSDIARIRFGDKITWRGKDGFTIIEEEWLKEKAKRKDKTANFYENVSLELVLSVYRNLRENYEFRLRYDDAGKFFIKEMELKREYREIDSEDGSEIRKNGWLRRHFSLTGLYYHLSRYGESISRPTLIAAITVFASTLFWVTQSHPFLEPHFSFFLGSNTSAPVADSSSSTTSTFIGFAKIGNASQWQKSFERSLADFIPFLSLGGDIKVGIIDYIIKIVGGALTFGLLLIAFRRKFERKYTR